MRSPFSRVPVRLKLSLGYALLCLLTLGVGGGVLASIARRSLEEQVHLRLEERAAKTRLLIEKDLELLQKRAEDFASDGFIRLEFERLQAEAPNDHGSAGHERLVRHLRDNKLALAEELVDAVLLDAQGAVLVRARSPAGFVPPIFDRETSWLGPLVGPTPAFPFSTFALSTPVKTLDGSRRLGYLLLVVRSDVWATRLRPVLLEMPSAGLDISLGGANDDSLPLLGKAEEPETAGENDGQIRFSTTDPETGWSITLAADRKLAMAPVRALKSTLVWMGLVVVALTVLFFLPFRTLLKRPLAAVESLALAEAELRHQKVEIRFQTDRLNAVIESIRDGLFILDRGGAVVLANAAARPLIATLASSCRNLPDEPCAGRKRGNPASCIACLASFRGAAAPCVVKVAERSYELRVAPLRFAADGEVDRIFLLRDITEERRQAAQQAHQERLSVVGEIASAIAHELNNPLAAISMFSQMLLNGLDVSSPLHGHAQLIHRNTLACKHTLSSLLEMAARTPTTCGAVDLRDLVAEVVELLSPLAASLRVNLRVAQEASEGTMWADGHQLRQAVVNLVMNAIQAAGHADRGEVRAGTKLLGEELVIRVEDNGPGVPSTLAERIFEPFFTTKAAGEGTGLGLPTSRRIVEAHGGALELCPSATGRGAAFEIRLPRPAAGIRSADEPALPLELAS